MGKVIKSLIGKLFTDKGRIVGAEEIQQILFHRNLKLLLDRVVMVGSTVVGEFKVTPEVCEGHEPAPGKPVYRGVDLIEMGFQLLGVFLAKNLDIVPSLQGKKVVAREVLSAKFSGFIFPGDTVFLEMKTDIFVEQFADVTIVESDRMIARVNGKQKGQVAVSIVGFEPEKLEE